MKVVAIGAVSLDVPAGSVLVGEVGKDRRSSCPQGWSTERRRFYDGVDRVGESWNAAEEKVLGESHRRREISQIERDVILSEIKEARDVITAYSARLAELSNRVYDLAR